MDLIDIGVNLTHKQFAGDLPDVVARAEKAGVSRMIVTGTSLRASRAALDLAARYPDRLFSTAGVHPHDAKSWDASHESRLAELLGNPACVAVGECGLDYNRDFSPRDVQRRVFEKQIDIAVRRKAPLFTHERDAHADFLSMIREIPKTAPVVVHCFTGTLAEAESYLAEGCFIGLTGWICDERRGAHLADVVRAIPLDRLMLETDAPYVAPRDVYPRPSRNEPMYLAHIAEVIARAAGVPAQRLAAAATANSERFFGI
ncbi:MAG: TatD family hydrolase [Clostridiales bacterium]|jgi:TatD DNase family protein|nr:TatD family hydrolase [Clostridiales bacterium]